MTHSSSIERSVVALIQDAMSLALLPGSTTAGLLIERLFRSRFERAQEILLDELSRGRTTLDDAEVEKTVAMLYCYMRAAQEGAARLNLRLMAKVIAGQKESRTLTASEFLYHADILASLRREEIILLATVYKHWLGARQDDEREAAGWKGAMRELIPSLFKHGDELFATGGAIARTGLLIASSGWGGGMAYRPSPLMHKLHKLISFEDALSAEGGR